MESTGLSSRHHRDVPRVRGRLPQDHRQGQRQDQGARRGGRQCKGRVDVLNILKGLAHRNETKKNFRQCKGIDEL